jgi:hypothetical protein
MSDRFLRTVHCFTSASGPQYSSERHYMYVSPEEDHFFRELIVKFIVATGQTIGASEALRVMMYLAFSAAADEQIADVYQRAKQGDGKRMT